MPEVLVTDPPISLRTFHGVLTETDYHASDAATIDLIAMAAWFMDARVVVEAGTYKGHFALALGNILRLRGPGGMVYTADPIDNFSKTLALPEADAIRPHIWYYGGDFKDMLEDVVPDPIDLAYIDASSKDNPHMRFEHYAAVWHRMREGGLIFVDDTEGDWEDARKLRFLGNLHLKQGRGLTVIQK